MNQADNQPIKKANIYFIGAVAAISGLLFGFDTGVISGAQEFLLKTFNIGNEGLHDNMLHGLMVSAVPIGALFGAMVSGICAKHIGRKQSIMFTAILFLIGTLIAACAMNLNSVVYGRLIMGFAIGISAMVAPMYLGEVSPPKVRGTIIFSFQLAITIGLFAAFGINLWFSKIMADPAMNWRWMFGVAAIPSLLLFFGMLRMPNSPRHLALKGKTGEAKVLMQRLLGKEDVSSEMKEMYDSMKRNTGSTWATILKPPYLSLLFIAFGLFVFQQLSGINAIMYYGPEVFQSAGFGEEAKFWAQLLMGLTNVLATLLGIWLIDRAGRRPLLFAGFIGMVICLGVTSYCLGSNMSHPYISLASVLVYVICFAFSLGGVPYVLMSELFPLKIRPAGMAIASCANWGFNMLIAFTFEMLVSYLGGMEKVFMIYGLCTGVGFFFAWRFVPETKGCPLEEIEDNFFHGKNMSHLGDEVNAHHTNVEELESKADECEPEYKY